MNVEVLVDDLENNPQCFHGPSLRFRKYGTKDKEYYACSACRDHKECPFYVEASDKKLEKLKRCSKWTTIRAETIQNIFAKNPYKKYLRILKSLKSTEDSEGNVSAQNNLGIKKKNKKLINKNGDDSKDKKKLRISAAYCYSCDELLESCAIENHNDCKVINNLTEYQLKHPTEILIPKEDSKTHAQYFFSKETVKNIILLLKRIGSSRVLCIGSPRIHEYLVNECKGQCQSLLLDIDLKYYNFYSEKQFVWYNMFNNYALSESGNKTLEEFLHSEKITVLIDPPFGGRVEPLACTLNALNKLYCCRNGFDESGESELSVMWIFPYFMERHIKASLPNFRMFDLKIDYDNHVSFTNVGTRKRKFGSPVRIFTNIPLSLLSLDGVDGYKFCKICGYWVSEENRHCDECNYCTSKNGRTYVHCWKCSRCVKPSYQHCEKCEICTLPNHECGKVETEAELTCYHCRQPGHKKRECPEFDEADVGNRKKLKRRRHRRD